MDTILIVHQHNLWNNGEKGQKMYCVLFKSKKWSYIDDDTMKTKIDHTTTTLFYFAFKDDKDKTDNGNHNIEIFFTFSLVPLCFFNRDEGSVYF